MSLIASRAHDSVPAVVLNREITTAQWQTRRVTVFRSAKLARLLPVGTQVFLCKFTKRVARSRRLSRSVPSALKGAENYLKIYACTYLDFSSSCEFASAPVRSSRDPIQDDDSARRRVRASENRARNSHIIRRIIRRRKEQLFRDRGKYSSGQERRGCFVRGEPSWSHDCTMPVCAGNDYRSKSFPQPSLARSAFISCPYFLIGTRRELQLNVLVKSKRPRYVAAGRLSFKTHTSCSRETSFRIDHFAR